MIRFLPYEWKKLYTCNNTFIYSFCSVVCDHGIFWSYHLILVFRNNKLSLHEGGDVVSHIIGVCVRIISMVLDMEIYEDTMI